MSVKNYILHVTLLLPCNFEEFEALYTMHAYITKLW